MFSFLKGMKIVSLLGHALKSKKEVLYKMKETYDKLLSDVRSDFEEKLYDIDLEMKKIKREWSIKSKELYDISKSAVEDIDKKKESILRAVEKESQEIILSASSKVNELVEDLTKSINSKKARKRVGNDTSAEIIRLYEEGLSQTEIVRRLGISQSTVHFYVKKSSKYNGKGK